MALYLHELFTIDLNKVVTVNQEEEEPSITIRTDDQRKLEVAAATHEDAAQFLKQFADAWESAVGPLIRHGKYVFLTSAIYSIQAEGEEVYLYFREHSVSFSLPDAVQALQLLSELTLAWQLAIGEEPTPPAGSE